MVFPASKTAPPPMQISGHALVPQCGPSVVKTFSKKEIEKSGKNSIYIRLKKAKNFEIGGKSNAYSLKAYVKLAAPPGSNL